MRLRFVFPYHSGGSAQCHLLGGSLWALSSSGHGVLSPLVGSLLYFPSPLCFVKLVQDPLGGGGVCLVQHRHTPLLTLELCVHILCVCRSLLLGIQVPDQPPDPREMSSLGTSALLVSMSPFTGLGSTLGPPPPHLKRLAKKGPLLGLTGAPLRQGVSFELKDCFELSCGCPSRQPV